MQYIIFVENIENYLFGATIRVNSKPGGHDIRDWFLKPVKIFSTVKTQFVFVAVEIFKIETFESRLSCVKIFIEIVKIYQDISTLLRLF